MTRVVQLPMPLAEAFFLGSLMAAAKDIAGVVQSLQTTTEPKPMLGALLTVFGNAAVAAGLSREQTLGFLRAYESEVFDNWDLLQADHARGRLLFSTPKGGAS